VKRSAIQRKTTMARGTPLRSADGKARMSVPAPRTKRCKACREPFTAFRPMAVACSPKCAEKIAEAARIKAEKRAHAIRREALKPRSKWLQEAQAAFNKWIRARDAALPCVSCGRHHGGKWNAGHYLSTGARPELRFDEANVHKQCEPCNSFLSGNVVLYRAELIRRVGLAEVERLEGPQAPRKYTSEELKSIKDMYRRLGGVLKGHHIENMDA